MFQKQSQQLLNKILVGNTDDPANQTNNLNSYFYQR
jgi:hypothetical protein